MKKKEKNKKHYDKCWEANMKITLQRFLSRKLIVTVGTIITAVGAKQYTAAAITAVAYLIAQGLVDFKTVKEAGKLAEDVEVAVKAIAPLLPSNAQEFTKIATLADEVTKVVDSVKKK